MRCFSPCLEAPWCSSQKYRIWALPGIILLSLVLCGETCGLSLQYVRDNNTYFMGSVIKWISYPDIKFLSSTVPSMLLPNQTYFEYQKDTSFPVSFSQKPLLRFLGKSVTTSRNAEKGALQPLCLPGCSVPSLNASGPGKSKPPACGVWVLTVPNYVFTERPPGTSNCDVLHRIPKWHDSCFCPGVFL